MINVRVSALLGSALGLLALSALGGCGDDKGPPVATVPQNFVMPVDLGTGTGLPPSINDPGPGPIDTTQCAPAGIEIVVLDNFEAGKATKTYTFDDSTAKVHPLSNKDWEPASATIPANWSKPCGPGGTQSTMALHLAGVFKDFGAGLGTVLFNHVADLNPTDVKVPFTDLTTSIVPPPAHPIIYWDQMPDPDHPYIVGMQSADLSAWDGITFWARRGAFAGPGIRPGILDRTSSDDFNKQLPPEKASCRSIYTTCSCTNLRPCTHWKASDPGASPTADQVNASIEPIVTDLLEGDFCWDPKLDGPWPKWDPTLRCGQTACDFHLATPIPAMTYNPVSHDEARLWEKDVGAGPGINTMTCSPEPYVFRDSTTPSARFCYRPGVDADPAEKADRCNDSFLSGTLLDTNWKRYMIPFADLRQGSVDQRSPGIDLTMVEALVFAFPGGNLDLWLDDVGFYRKVKK